MTTCIHCTECNHSIPVNDWYDGYMAADGSLYYFKCKGCLIKLGSTLLLDGKISIWNKAKEK